MSAEGGDDTDTDSEWLDPMNAARSAVGEAALTWDPIAAQVAQAWADGCMFMHDANGGAQYDAMGGSGGLGENISAGAPTETATAAVASWVGEMKYYDHANNTCASGQVCGHYTQIVWAATQSVGCAKAHCTTNSPFKGFTDWDFGVCDFSPPGNVGSEAPY